MSRVAPAGDVNGDDEPDLLVAGSDRARRGIVRVFFGPLPRENTSLGKTPEHGFSIYLADEDDLASSAAAAGDVNGDGLGDVVVGSLGANEDSGRAYVVFGTREPDDVYLATFDAGTQGSDGFRVDGGGLGSAVGGVGDTDGDGLADFFVATPFRHLYVVRGKTDQLPVDLTTFDYGIQGDAGYRIHQQMPRTGLYNAGSAGDVNGDGLGDVVLATERRNFDYDVWVVFGKPGNADVQLEELGEGGFFIEGSIGDAGSGLSAAGDVNGDDKDDLVVGAGSANMAYVVFGRAETSSISLFELGRRGYRIFGEPRAPGTYLGRAGGVVTGGTDVNGDGLSDFVVTDYEAGHRGPQRVGVGLPTLRQGELEADPAVEAGVPRGTARRRGRRRPPRDHAGAPGRRHRRRPAGPRDRRRGPPATLRGQSARDLAPHAVPVIASALRVARRLELAPGESPQVRHLERSGGRDARPGPAGAVEHDELHPIERLDPDGLVLGPPAEPPDHRVPALCYCDRHRQPGVVGRGHPDPPFACLRIDLDRGKGDALEAGHDEPQRVRPVRDRLDSLLSGRARPGNRRLHQDRRQQDRHRTPHRTPPPLFRW